MVFVQTWTAEQEQFILQMERDGFPHSEIARTVRRSRAAVGAKLWHLRNPDGKSRAMRIRQERRDAVKGQPRRTAYAGCEYVDICSARPTEEMIADRDARHNAPRSITGTLMGDPPLGFSALDRK
jgi:hypothetical protein